MLFDNWWLEIEENCNSLSSEARGGDAFREGGGPLREARKKFLAKRIRAHDGCLGIGRR